MHPNLPWDLIAIYVGNVTIFDFDTQSEVRSIEVTNAPVRCAKFVLESNGFLLVQMMQKLEFTTTTLQRRSRQLKSILTSLETLLCTQLCHISFHAQMTTLLRCSTGINNGQKLILIKIMNTTL